MIRAYSILTLKSVDEKTRRFTGIATTTAAVVFLLDSGALELNAGNWVEVTTGFDRSQWDVR